jgi:lipopolysaccharide transport protein LptA
MVLCCGWSHGLLAESPNSKTFSVQKIQVTCDDGMHVKTKDKQASFRKNVDLKLDSFRLRCDSLVITYSEGKNGEAGVESLLATGSVRVDDPVRDIMATCDRVTYQKSDGWLKMSSDGLTKVRQEGNHMEAKTIKLNVETNEVLVEGQGSVEININNL